MNTEVPVRGELTIDFSNGKLIDHFDNDRIVFQKRKDGEEMGLIKVLKK